MRQVWRREAVGALAVSDGAGWMQADVVSYSTVINAFAKLGDARSAEQWLTKMIDAGVEANVQSYSTVVSAFAKAGDADGAEKWLARMHDAGIKGDTISYTAVINACAKVGNVQKAETWLVRMLEVGVEPNLITFNAVVSACAKAGNGRRAEEWIEKMKQAEVLPNSFSYNQAAKPYVAKGDYRRVEKLMSQLRSYGLPYDDFCLTSLLYAYSNAQPKQRQRAEETFREYASECVELSRNALSALARVLGRGNAEALCEKCGVDWKAVEAQGGGGNSTGRPRGIKSVVM